MSYWDKKMSYWDKKGCMNMKIIFHKLNLSNIRPIFMPEIVMLSFIYYLFSVWFLWGESCREAKWMWAEYPWQCRLLLHSPISLGPEIRLWLHGELELTFGLMR